MTIKFIRSTHDENGFVRQYLNNGRASEAWQNATFSGHAGSSTTPLTFSELVEEHKKYDKDWPDEPFGYTIPEMLRGLADLLDAGLFEVVEED